MMARKIAVSVFLILFVLGAISATAAEGPQDKDKTHAQLVYEWFKDWKAKYPVNKAPPQEQPAPASSASSETGPALESGGVITPAEQAATQEQPAPLEQPAEKEPAAPEEKAAPEEQAPPEKPVAQEEKPVSRRSNAVQLYYDSLNRMKTSRDTEVVKPQKQAPALGSSGAGTPKEAVKSARTVSRGNNNAQKAYNWFGKWDKLCVSKTDRCCKACERKCCEDCNIDCGGTCCLDCIPKD